MLSWAAVKTMFFLFLKRTMLPLPSYGNSSVTAGTPPFGVGTSVARLRRESGASLPPHPRSVKAVVIQAIGDESGTELPLVEHVAGGVVCKQRHVADCIDAAFYAIDCVVRESRDLSIGVTFQDAVAHSV